MKFILGLLTGLVLGAVGTVAYSLQTGRDLREAFDEVRSDLDRRDFDALGSRLEARVAELQTRLEDRIAQVREHVPTTADDIDVDPIAAEAGAAVAEAGAAVAETVEPKAEEQAGA